MPTFKSIEDINVWNESINLVELVYQAVQQNSKLKNDFGLRDQMQRASVSIPSNIAEGFERESNQEFIRFLSIAKGSSGELRTQLLIAFKLGYLHEQMYTDLNERCKKISSMLMNLIKSLRQ